MKIMIKIICCLAMFLCVGCSSNSHLDPKNPVAIKLWNYYTGKQAESFNQLVENFNAGVGKEKGIIIEVTGFGSVNELGQSVIDAADKKVGAKDVPHIFAAYADTVYQIDQKGLVEDLSPYFSQKELAEYIDGYIEEGKLDQKLKIFPTAKSTEIMMINMTDFQKFSTTTNVQLSDLSTIEGLVDVSKKYYEYTDSLTTTPNDGKAFFGRDAIANYIVLGLKQQGYDIVQVNGDQVVLDFDKAAVRKLWDYYYLPYIHGYFTSKGRFRSDDVKMGNIISFVGASSGATFFPNQVIVDDETSYPIDVKVMEAPLFKDAKPYAVQQGAGLVVTKSDESHVEASVEFLKWFTSQQQNISFSIDSGYLPVKKVANQMEVIEKTTQIDTVLMKEVIEVSVNTVNNKQLYTTPVFDHANQLRTYLEECLKEKANTDYQKVIKELKSQKNSSDIYSHYENDENFEQWYQDTYKRLQEIVG